MTPDPEAKRRALEAMIHGVDPIPVAPASTTVPGPDDSIQQELERLRSQAEERARFADLGAVSSQAIEGLTSARGADVWATMRQRAEDPLKDFLKLQEMKSQSIKSAPKPGKGPLSTDPLSEASKRKQSLVKATLGDVYSDDEIARMTEGDAEQALKYGSMRGTREVGREGQTAATERARLDREQRGKIWAEQRSLRWEEMDLDERELAERIAAREAAATAKETARVEDQSKEFGVKYAEGGFPEFKDQYAKAQQIFAKYPKGLPGVGIAAGRVPRRFTSEDGKMLRSVFGQMMLSYKKSVTGLGSSQKEDDAIRDATGLVQTGDDESMRMGVSILKDVMDAKENALQAGYKQEAVDAVVSRLNRSAPTNRKTPSTPVPPKTGPRRKRDKSGQLWEEQPDGSAKKVPG